MIIRMWQGAHVLPISYNYENKREVLRRPPTGLQLFFKSWHTEGIIYYFTLLCQAWALIASPPWTYKLRPVIPAPISWCSLLYGVEQQYHMFSTTTVIVFAMMLQPFSGLYGITIFCAHTPDPLEKPRRTLCITKMCWQGQEFNPLPLQTFILFICP